LTISRFPRRADEYKWMEETEKHSRYASYSRQIIFEIWWTDDEWHLGILTFIGDRTFGDVSFGDGTLGDLTFRNRVLGNFPNRTHERLIFWLRQCQFVQPKLIFDSTIPKSQSWIKFKFHRRMSKCHPQSYKIPHMT
jgi:hypothetical protein